MIIERKNPEAPSSAPAMTSTLLLMAKPVAAAAALEPNRSLLRSYLGKAFAHEAQFADGVADRGELHGVWTWYRASGVLLQRGAFDHGTKDGAWERWDAQGNHLVQAGTQTQAEKLNAIPQRSRSA